MLLYDITKPQGVKKEIFILDITVILIWALGDWQIDWLWV